MRERTSESCVASDVADGAAGSEAYLAWKHWSIDQFGVYKAGHAAYFSAELAFAGRPADGARLLEIGFGQGGFMAFARKSSYLVSGIEANPLLVTAAQRAGFEAYGSLAELPVDAHFDVVAAFDVLEHIPLVDLPEFLREIARKLKPGGVLIARFPNGDSPFGRTYQNGDITHVTTLGVGRVRQLAQIAGLDLLRCAAQPEPILGAGFAWGLYRLFVLPVRFVFEAVLVRLYFPRGGVSFAPNLSAVFRKPVKV